MRLVRLPPMLAAVSLTTVAQLPNFLTGALAVQIRGQLGIAERQLGLAVAAFFLTSAVASPLLGRLADTVGSPRMLRLTALGSAVVLEGIAAGVDSWAALLVALALAGAANGGGQPAANLLLLRTIRGSRQGLAFGVKQAAIPAAVVLAGMAVPSVALTVGWRWAFAGGGLLAALIALMLPTGSRPNPAPPRQGPVANRSRPGLARGPLVLIAGGAGLGSAAANALGTYFVLSAVADGVGNGTAGLLAVLGGLASMAARVAVGYVADRRGSRHLLVVAVMLAAGTLGFLLLATGHTWALAPGAVLAYGVGWGWAGLLNFAIATSHPHNAGAATGLVQAGTATGGMLGPLTFGVLVSLTSYTTSWLAAASVLATGALIVLLGRWRLRTARTTPGADVPHTS